MADEMTTGSVSDKDGEISTLQGEPEEKTFSILNIEIGTSYEEVEKKLGQPERITYNEYGNLLVHLS